MREKEKYFINTNTKTNKTKTYINLKRQYIEQELTDYDKWYYDIDSDLWL